MTSDDPFQALQLEIHARLDCDAYFDDLPIHVILPRASDAETAAQASRVQKAATGTLEKAGKYGCAIFIESPDANSKDETIGPRLVTVPQITVIEKPEINLLDHGTGKSAERVALYIAQLLFQQFIGRLTADVTMGTFGKAKINTPKEPESPRLVTITFELDVQPTPLARCGQCTITAAALQVTLACATSGAEIYYTTDGSYPYAGNTEATLYAAPFTVETGTTVRAVAHKLGLTASPVLGKLITT